MTSHVIAYRSLELLFGTHTFHFNCFFDDFNCVFTQIRCLSRVLVLQYDMTIITYTQQLLDMEDLLDLSKLYSRDINFYCKKLTQWKLDTGF